MKPSKYQWQMKEVGTDNPELTKLLEKAKINKNLAPLFKEQGIETEAALRKFLHPDLSDLYDPFQMYDMAKAVERIHKAVADGEEILVYGDYDADGITSTTVMKEALELMGANVHFYLPNRFTDGYGPNERVFIEAIESGISLIITVDNGVAGHGPLALAKSQQVDVIVTDHHELPDELPEAYALIHPRHPKGTYPFGDLAGVGVAFKLATALLGEPPAEFLDLVALGTVADLVSLTDENRILVQLGLSALKNTERVGILALVQSAKIDLTQISEETIGFTLAPRLNALGRLGDATPGVNLLTTFDEEEADSLAKDVEKCNQERQKIVAEITTEALEMAKADNHPILVLAKKGWHEGVLGIVASRVAQEVGKPAIILQLNADETQLKGSGRSVAALNLYAALDQARPLLTHFGGHHMAAGLTLPAENLESLKLELTAYVEKQALDFSSGGILEVQLALPLEEATVDFIEELKILAPFGTDHPKPVFLIQGQVKDPRQIGADLKHLKYSLFNETTILDCIAFQAGSDILEFAEQTQISVVGDLSINEWNGQKKPQLQMQDYQVAGLQVFDLRGKKKANIPLPQTNIGYLHFHEEKAPIEEVQHYSVADFPQDVGQMVLLDCPDDLETLKKVFHHSQVHRVYLKCQSQAEFYLNGMPTRQQFAALFRFIKQFPNVDVRYKLQGVQDYLKIPRDILIFMIQVFAELQFVTLDEGIMNAAKQPQKQALEESALYQKRLKQIEVEKFLLYSSVEILKNWFDQQEEK